MKTDSDLFEQFMDNDFDLFEQFPDASKRWLCCVHGAQNIATKLFEAGKKTENEIVAINLSTGNIVASTNHKRAWGAS